MKKIINVFIATVLSVSAVFSAACNKDKGCVHNVGTWEVTTPATCTAKGEEKGTCGICLEELRRETDIAPDAHTYGEWAIQTPTETTEGSATKTCVHDSAHTYVEILPVLKDTKYESSITRKPTATVVGERTYTLKNEAGDIVFTQEVAAEVKTVRDAVELSVSKDAKALIRNSEVRNGYQFIRSNDEVIKGDDIVKTNVVGEGGGSFITGTVDSNLTITEGSREYAVAGEYSDKLTVGTEKAYGGITLSYAALLEDVDDYLDEEGVYFKVYNSDSVAHRYSFFHKMMGNRNASEYEGTLAPESWTTLFISAKMIREAKADVSNQYKMFADVVFYNTEYEEGGTNETKSFYVDSFQALVSKSEYQSTALFGTNEKGEKYTYLQDGAAENCERWFFTVLDGETNKETIYGVSNRDGSNKYQNDMVLGIEYENYLLGPRVGFTYGIGLHGVYYGAEQLLEALYNEARWSTNNDFEERVLYSGDEIVGYTFSFGVLQNSGEYSGFFGKITVTFTLTDSYTIASLRVNADAYVNNLQQVDGSKLLTWEVLPDGNGKILEGKENEGTRYANYIEFTQTNKQPGEIEPENIHTLDKMFIQSFDIMYNGVKVPEGQPVEFGAKTLVEDNPNTEEVEGFAIANILPNEALTQYNYDNFSVYLRTEKGDQYIDYGSMATEDILVQMDPETKKFRIKSELTGSITLVIRTSNLERVLECIITKAVPTSLRASVYAYKNGEFTWLTGWESATYDFSSKNKDYKICVNQPVYFRPSVPIAEEGFASTEYEIDRLRKDASVVYTISNPSNYSQYFSSDYQGGKEVTKFVPTEIGTYEVRMRYPGGGRSCTLRFKVEAAPALSGLAAETYEQRMQYPAPMDITVTFTAPVAGTKDFEDEGSGTVTEDVYTLQATIATLNDGTEVLNCTYRISTGTLESEYAAGRDLGFRLGMNVYGDFELSKYSSLLGGFETVVLQVKVS